MLFQNYFLEKKYSLNGQCRTKIGLHFMCSLILIYIVRHRSRSSAQLPKTSKYHGDLVQLFRSCLELISSITRGNAEIYNSLAAATFICCFMDMKSYKDNRKMSLCMSNADSFISLLREANP